MNQVIKLTIQEIFGQIIVWTPHFGSMRFPLDGELDFLIFEKLIFY